LVVFNNGNHFSLFLPCHTGTGLIRSSQNAIIVCDRGAYVFA